MADKKISELTSHTGENLADGDLLHIVDISEADNADKNKSITIKEIEERWTRQSLTTFTPTFAAGTATFTGQTGWYYQRGVWMVGRAFGGITGAGSAEMTMDIPSSLTIDTDWLLNITAAAQNDSLGYGKFFDAGSAYRSIVAFYHSTTQIKFMYDGGAALLGAALANGDYLNFNFEIPIAEWA